MRLVVGLGNPGARYAATRHNIGFRVVERLATRHRAVFAPDDDRSGRLARAAIAGIDCALLEPTTFMNRSGESVQAALASWPHLRPDSDLLVVYDDLDLPTGRLRLRGSGGAGGHRGMADLVRALETTGIPRLRFGIGHPGQRAAVVDWVLEPFLAAEEAEVLPAAIERAADAIECFLREGLAAAMDRFNAAV
ncbi:MAG: aminoacyl-tRNA hydrolase [Myxococcota bacterium]